MKKPSVVVILGCMGFLLSVAGGIGFFAVPNGLPYYLDITQTPIESSADGVIFLVRTLALLDIAVGLAYLLAMLDRAAARSLLIVATCDKFLGVLAALLHLFPKSLNDKLLAGYIINGILALVGIYAIVVAGKQKNTAEAKS